MILVIGSGGQLGQEIFKQNKIFKQKIIFKEKTQLNICDTNKIKKLIVLKKIKIIINAAALTKVDLCEKEKKLCMEINFYAVKRLTDICKIYDIFLIHISSDYVYHGRSKNNYTEKSKKNPKNTYGLSKYYADKYICKYLNKFIIIRSGWIFSKNSNNFLGFIKSTLKNHDSINLVNNQTGNPTSARSLSIIIFKFLDKFTKEGLLKYGVYNFCNFPSTTWYNYGKFYIKEVLKLEKAIINKIDWKTLNLNADRPTNTKLNCQKINTYLKLNKKNWKKELFKI
jgi:dTDP-4-dehydrorhamnose reductase